MSEPTQEPDERSTLEFMGETFHMNPGDEYQWEMMEFAGAATGVEVNSLSGAAAVYGLLKAVIVSEEWERFRRAARSGKAQVDRDLMPLVVTAFMQRTGRPTSPPSGSASGRALTPPSSEVADYSQVVRDLEQQGRPDVAYMVLMAQEGKGSPA